MRKLFALSFVFILFLPKPASAHVLLRDDSKQIGAVLHVNPDDDPVAGQSSNLFFDIQGKQDYTADLKITDSSGNIETPKLNVSGNTASVDYNFPFQGIYNLELTIKSSDGSYIFKHSQRVERGAAISALDKPSHPLAGMALVMSISLFLLMFVIIFNRRKEIAAQSKF